MKNKFLSVTIIISMSVVSHGLQGISLRQWIQQHGQPEIVNGVVNLNNQGLTSLKGLEDLANPEAIKALSLNSNQLQSMPESIGQLANLQRLYLYNNQLQSLPESIGQLANLTQLSLVHNRLQSLPESIGQLANLTQLSLVHNRLQSLPDSIGQLAKLQGLHLDDNQLQTLPGTIGNLTNIVVFNLNDNPLPGITNEILINNYLRGRRPPLLDFRTPDKNTQAHNERRLLDIVELRDPKIHPGITENVAQKIREIARKLPSIAFQVEGGNTLLHKAVMKRDLQMFHLLLSINPELIAIKNNEGITPMDIAVQYDEFKALLSQIAKEGSFYATVARLWRQIFGS